MRSNERERLARRDAYKQEQALKSALKLGERGRCFMNSMDAVWKFPQRLKYVEGFEIIDGLCMEKTCPCYGRTLYNHHARVLDTVTGKVHEVTPGHDSDDHYIYRVFAKSELVNPYEEGEDGKPLPIEGPEWWAACQLTLRQQYDLLTSSGYAVDLCIERKGQCFRNCTCDVYEEPRLADIATVNMNDRMEHYYLEQRMGEGWVYEWYKAGTVKMRAEEQSNSSLTPSSGWCQKNTVQRPASRTTEMEEVAS